jgi:SpoVK/Ycf46/Vps4 family AAA+-type ATPase
MSDLTKEKDRLMKEVLGSKRAWEKKDKNEEKIELQMDPSEKPEKPVSGVKSALKSADEAMKELQKILRKQTGDIQDLQKEQESIKPLGVDQTDLDQLASDLEKDYGVRETKEVKSQDSRQIFEDAGKELSKRIRGQENAIRQLTTAFRRPFVMGRTPGHPENVILITGPHGSGRHQAVADLTRYLASLKILKSPDVRTIDLSRYTSSSQEQIFLQDLYEALSSDCHVLCFENFDSAFPGFLRMVDALAVEGNAVLSKRYVSTKGVLVENQTGLVKDAVDSLSSEGKYLVFFTSGKAEKVQDAFGADFMRHVLDVVTFTQLDEKSVQEIIDEKAEELEQKCSRQLNISIQISSDIRSWVKEHYDKSAGADGISSLYHDFYLSLSQAVLEGGSENRETLQTIVKEDVPYVQANGKEIRLSRSKNRQEEIDAVNAELDQIVGLDMVKEYIRSLQAHIAMNERRKAQGLKTAAVSKHMIFTGNPGTGKTTIARLISRYMKAIGALSQGQLVEVTRADLVAQYVGQTAPLTMNVIRSALGGVLFIDEAYSLYRGRDDSFGLEAIDTLVKAMEDHREDLIVILAGYRREMSFFLESNSGLKSRFPNLIDFPDYTGEELTKIAAIQAKAKGYVIADEAKEPLKAYFDKVQSINAAEAGNGRLARNLVEEAILKQSARVSADPQADLSLLEKDDFDYTVKVKAPENDTEESLAELVKKLQG